LPTICLFCYSCFSKWSCNSSVVLPQPFTVPAVVHPTGTQLTALEFALNVSILSHHQGNISPERVVDSNHGWMDGFTCCMLALHSREVQNKRNRIYETKPYSNTLYSITTSQIGICVADHLYLPCGP
jgi:hypothetical protein